MAPEPPPAGWRRLHVSSLLFDAGRHAASLVLWAGTAVFVAARSQEAWFLVFLLLPLLEALVRFASFRYALTGEQLVLREGVLVRTLRHVPYARIQNIDTLQGPLHRLLGVVEVRLETASGEEPEAVFRVVSTAQLAELRAGVFGAGRAAPGPPGEERPAPFFRMSVGDILLFGLLAQKGLLVLGGAWVALHELDLWGALERRFAHEAEVLEDRAQALDAWRWALVAVVVLLLLQGASVLWSFLKLAGFRIERRGEDLRTTCGLFTRQTASLPRGRVQYLEVRQSLVQRLLGRASVRALTAGGESDAERRVARHWIVPLAPRRELARILAEVQPAADFEGVRWRAVHAHAWRRLFARALLVLLVPALLLAAYSPLLGALALVGGALGAALAARARARVLAWGLSDEAVFLRDGLLARRLACVRFEKVQSLALVRTPLDRRARMARIALDTAGASKAAPRFVIPFLGLREARFLMRALERRSAALDFRW